jgi:C-terminal processing protease CtpA/Prc
MSAFCIAIIAILMSSIPLLGMFTSVEDAPVEAAAPIDAATRTRVIDGVLTELNKSYVFPDVAKKMETAIRERAKKGEYDSLTDGKAFAEKLTEDLRAICQDKHLRITFHEKALPPRQKRREPTAEDQARFLTRVRRDNCGVTKVERLPGNLGYLALDFFAGDDVAGAKYGAAMSFLADTDALILDLRTNRGGDPAMVALLCSYFLPGGTHVNSIYWRPTDETRQHWTADALPGPRYLDKPVYVLTSKGTFSGGEECAYDFQTQKRGTLVGETTGGGANPGGVERLDDHFSAFIPMGRAINPITKTNWEGVGVKPEVAVDAKDALVKAQRLALEGLLAKETDPERKKEREDALKELNSK